jgi:hypothetical protein
MISRLAMQIEIGIGIHIAPAVARMSCSTRVRSSPHILNLGLAQHGVAETRGKALRRAQVHRPAAKQPSRGFVLMRLVLSNVA